MTNFKFEPIDFAMFRKISAEHLQSDMKTIADIANAKLQAWLDEAPVVYGHKVLHSEDGIDWYWVDAEDIFDDTHKARLVEVQEI